MTQNEHAGIAGKVVAITGASSGIGEATARHLARLGARVIVGARRTDRLEAVVAELRAGGAELEYRALDVTQCASVEDFVGFARDRFGRLDVLVNNAGLMPLSPLAALHVEAWERMVDVNIKGVLYGIAAALPVFEAQGHGHVINVSSIAAHRVVPTAAVYCATKAAVNSVTEGLRQESRTIRTTIISPALPSPSSAAQSRTQRLPSGLRSTASTRSRPTQSRAPSPSRSHSPPTSTSPRSSCARQANPERAYQSIMSIRHIGLEGDLR